MTSLNPHQENHVRTCCVCDSQLYGRSDKVFCNISCKNKYHGVLRKHNKSVSTQTINKLNKNYQILCYLLGENSDSFVISKLELIRLGFQFEILSGIESNKFGFKFSIYEFTYYVRKNKEIVVDRSSAHSEISPYVYKRWKNTYSHLQMKT